MKKTRYVRCLNLDDPVEYLAPPHLFTFPYNPPLVRVSSFYPRCLRDMDRPNAQTGETDRQLLLPFGKEQDDE